VTEKATAAATGAVAAAREANAKYRIVDTLRAVTSGVVAEAKKEVQGDILSEAPPPRSTPPR